MAKKFKHQLQHSGKPAKIADGIEHTSVNDSHGGRKNAGTQSFHPRVGKAKAFQPLGLHPATTEAQKAGMGHPISMRNVPDASGANPLDKTAPGKVLARAPYQKDGRQRYAPDGTLHARSHGDCDGQDAETASDVLAEGRLAVGK